MPLSPAVHRCVVERITNKIENPANPAQATRIWLTREGHLDWLLRAVSNPVDALTTSEPPNSPTHPPVVPTAADALILRDIRDSLRGSLEGARGAIRMLFEDIDGRGIQKLLYLEAKDDQLETQFRQIEDGDTETIEVRQGDTSPRTTTIRVTNLTSAPVTVSPNPPGLAQQNNNANNFFGVTNWTSTTIPPGGSGSFQVRLNFAGGQILQVTADISFSLNAVAQTIHFIGDIDPTRPRPNEVPIQPFTVTTGDQCWY